MLTAAAYITLGIFIGATRPWVWAKMKEYYAIIATYVKAKLSSSTEL